MDLNKSYGDKEVEFEIDTAKEIAKNNQSNTTSFSNNSI